jgi:hypothetical protein
MKAYARSAKFVTVLGRIMTVLIFVSLSAGCAMQSSCPPAPSASAWIQQTTDGNRQVYYTDGGKTVDAGRLTQPKAEFGGCRPGCIWTPFGCMC